MTPFRPSFVASRLLAAILTLLLSLACASQASAQGNLEYLLQSGIQLAQQERYPEAVQVLTECVARYPEVFEAHYNLSLALFALGRFEDALAAIGNTKPQGKSQEAARLYMLGKIHQGMGNLSLARTELSRVFNTFPDQENYSLDLALLLVREGDYPEAQRVLQLALQSHPDSAYLLLALAMAQGFGGKPKDGLATCGRLLKIDPELAAARLVMAFSAYMAGEYDTAERIAAAGLAGSSASPYLYYVHASALLKLESRDYSRMLKDLEIAERGITGCALCYFANSKVHYAAGNLKSAIADLETLVSMSPDFGQAWYRLAMLYREVGRSKDAARALARFKASRAPRTDPDTDLIRSALLPAH